MKHGASAYRNMKCRCDICRDGNREYQHRMTVQRRAARVLVDGRLVAPLPAERHGRFSTYSNHSCQCEPCTRAGAETNARTKARLRGKAA